MLVPTLSAALACGGLFCDTLAPVEQTEEAIVFDVDATTGTTTMHVTIGYQGPAEEFAWVLPIPGVPEVTTTHEALFQELQRRSRPNLLIEQWDDCAYGPSESDADADADADTDTDTDLDSDDGGPAPVVVVDQRRVGPYASVVLQATDAIALQGWLQTNGYGVPDGTALALAPYLGPEMHLLALKLASDATVGDLAPLAIRFPGTTPSIPLRLTALAAQDDMPATTYVLGESRAVPQNYLHMELNPLKADWVQGRWLDRLSRAADEAGGRAFTTTFAADLPARTGIDDATAAEALAVSADAATFVQEMLRLGRGWMTADDLLAVVPLPDDLDPNDYVACVTCFPDVTEAMAFDAPVWTDRFLTEVLQPYRGALETLSDRYVTRLDTTLSAEEMTVDPRFVFRTDLPDVPAERRLTLFRSCARDGSTARSRYEVTYDGHTFTAPSARELDQTDDTILSWLADLHPAETVRITSYAGAEPVDLVDTREDLWTAAEEATRPRLLGPVVPRGCATGPSASAFAWLPLLALLGRRRRVR
jgi:hypothetical protein